LDPLWIQSQGHGSDDEVRVLELSYFERPSKAHTWRVLRTTIFYLYSRLFPLVVRLKYDEDGVLASFAVTTLTKQE
jgi:hypothetical protein